VQHAIDKMLAVHCHRLWVVNDVNHLEGVVSQTDLIEALVDAYPVYSEERRAQLSQELPGSP
jgi:CBS-domain-containing membrane protein